MKSLLALVLSLMLAFAPAIALADEAASLEDLYYFPNAELGVELYIAPSWQHFVETDNVFPSSTVVRGEDGALVGGSTIFYFLPDPSVIAEVQTFDEANALVLENGIPLAGVITHTEGKAASELMPEGFEFRAVATENGVSWSAAWASSPDLAALGEEDAYNAGELIASFRDTDAYIVTSTPVSGIGALGHFHTNDIYGNEFDHTILEAGKLTLVNCWATFCNPCIEEMPVLAELSGEYADKGLMIIGVVTDVLDINGEINDSTLALAKEIAEATNANFTHLIPDNEILAGKLSTMAYVPTSFFINAEGEQIGEDIVGGMDKAGWTAAIEAALATLD